MRTSKLLILGTALLVLALPAHAEDEEASAPSETAAMESAGTDEPNEPAESAPPPEAAVVGAMPVPGGAAAEPMPEEDAPEAEEMAEVEGDPAEASFETEGDPAEALASEPVPADADPAAELPVAVTEPASAEDTSGILLGQVGYDSEGRPGRIHVVRRGDTLWFISDAYLGTPWVWPSIWQDNQDIANPHLIYPGDHIWITPSEMRKVTPEEAEALLAGKPAEPELTEPAAQDLAEVTIPGPAEPVATEQSKIRLSDREHVGLISADEIDAAASILANTAPRIMISQEDRIYIGLGAGDAVEGDQFTVLRVGSKVYDPETGRALGYHVEFLGWIEVLEVDVEASLALVRESSSEMFKGDKLVARRMPVSEIPLGDGAAGVEGQISYLPNSRTEMGMMDYVYLNRGTLDGVEVGTPLQVYRKGFKAKDPVAGGRRAIPDRVVAELVVVRSEPEASVAFVRHTEEELARGDFFRGAQ
ncbi:MAG: LysM peptidoglycan-binding domain-containing protein [Myxococcota bacterium]